MKVSEITVDDIANYIRLDEAEVEYKELMPLLEAAKSFIRGYTNMDDDEIDTHDDFYIVVMVLCQDMYDTRTMYVDKDNLNKVVDTILGMYSKNLIA